MNTLRDAIALLENGDWEAAHKIVQTDAHGIVHVLEGDLKNAGYWYGRAGREFAGAAPVEDEIAALKASLADG